MTTPKLQMPELVVGQAGKELTHNQALAVLDQLAQAVVVDKDLTAPPGSPANGAMYIVAASATGAWSGQSGKLAYWLTTVAAWTFITPADGWSVWVTDEAVRYERKAGAWVVVATGGGASLSVVQAFTGAKTLALVDINTYNVSQDATAQTVTLPAQATVAWTADAEITIEQGAVGAVTVTGAAGVTINGVVAPSILLFAKGAVATLKRKGLNDWTLVGSIGSAADQRTALGLGSASSPTFTALTLSNGQIAFPATQVPSADANTLDDYEEGAWTPTLTFSVPGDINVVYSTRTASYTKIGRVVSVNVQIITSTFTWTTSAGTALLTGLPFASNSLSRGSAGMQWSGITKTGYTDVAAAMSGGTSQFQFTAAASGLAFASVVAADMPSGGSINWTIAYTYFV